MLENISFIASVICALTAVTTSLRAVGTAREYSRHSSEAKLKSGCRINDYRMNAPSSQRSSLKLHFIVTVIWLLLSVIFIVPLMLQQGDGGADRPVIIFIMPFVLLIIVLCLIWRKVLRLKG